MMDEVGGIPLIYKSHKRAKRMKLKFDASSGAGVVTVPSYCSKLEAFRFAGKHLDWLEKQKKASPDRILLMPGSIVPIHGSPRTIVHDPDAPIADETTHDEIKAEHDRVVNSGGFGVPALFFPDGSSFFGPVLLEPPTGDAAVRLWNMVTTWVEFPHLYEMQRPKQAHDEQKIYETFKPYLEARDWVSINRGKEVGFEPGDR